jgi:hypothetical protein
MKMHWRRMDSYLKALIALEIAVASICGGLAWFSQPPKVKAASSFANVLCDGFKPISVTANAQLVTAGGPNNFIYVCSYNLNNSNAAASLFSFVEGTGTTCATNTLAVVGATTAAAGLTLGTNGGTVNYGGGSGAVAKTAVAGDNLCIFISTAGPVAGVIGTTQAPF